MKRKRFRFKNNEIKPLKKLFLITTFKIFNVFFSKKVILHSMNFSKFLI